MSFLEPGDPETLAEALAFVDGFDFSTESNQTDESSSGSDGSTKTVVEGHKRRRSERTAEQEGRDDALPDKHEKAKSRRRNAVYSARLRAKKKNEMQQLREQATQLQMQLERLKSTKSASTKGLHGAEPLTLGDCNSETSYWLQEATARAYQRQQAEQLNAQLKALLGKVVKRSKSMQDAFQNLQALGCEVNMAVRAPSTVLVGMSLRSNDATPQLEELRDYLDGMYANAHDVLAASGAGSADSATLISQIKRDPVSGRRVVQLSSSTPLEDDLDTASRMIWRGMQLKGSKCCKYHVHRLHVNTTSIAKSFFLTLGEAATPCTLHGAAFVRKFEERDRILYLWTTTMVPSSQESGSDSKSWKLRIREKGWTMLSRSPSDPEHASVFRSCYEVSSEVRDLGLDVGINSSAERNYDRISHGVLNLLSSDLRRFHERVQGTLLAESPLTMKA
ncbi:hypothetical protein PRNP1_013127 [Phytophthora ramorum]